MSISPPRARWGLRRAPAACAIAAASRRATTPDSPNISTPRMGAPVDLTYALLRWFHNAGGGTMVSTPSLSRELLARGFKRMLRWSRGVDHLTFNPAAAIPLDFPRPIFSLRGQARGRKKPRCVSLARPAGNQTCCRRRSGAPPARGAISKRALCWGQDRAGTRDALRELRRLRVSQPHRHFWHGAARGDGLRRAGRRFSHARAARCGRRPAAPVS